MLVNVVKGFIRLDLGETQRTSVANKPNIISVIKTLTAILSSCLKTTVPLKPILEYLREKITASQRSFYKKHDIDTCTINRLLRGHPWDLNRRPLNGGLTVYCSLLLSDNKGYFEECERQCERRYLNYINNKLPKMGHHTIILVAHVTGKPNFVLGSYNDVTVPSSEFSLFISLVATLTFLLLIMYIVVSIYAFSLFLFLL